MRPAFVFPMKTPQALCIARSLGRRGIPVIGLDENPHCPGLRSRYCRPVCTPDPDRHPEQWIEALVAQGEHLSEPAVLFPCNDQTLSLVSRYRDRLEPYFHKRIPSDEVITSLLNKSETYQKAEALGLTVPRHLFLKNEADLEKVEQTIGFPCAIKPIHSHLWKRHFPSAKLVVVQSKEELLKQFSNLRGHHLDFLATELIPGDDTQFYGLYTYLDKKGNPLFVYTKRKLRQYPAHFGNGSLHEGIWEPSVAALGMSFLKGIGYQGYAHMEFKRDPRDGTFKLIEVNPRCAIALPLVVASGIDAPYLGYQEMLGKSVDMQEARTYRKKLLFFEQDCDAFRAYHREGLLSWWGWIRSLWGTNVFGIFAWDDPMPFLYSIRRRLSSRMTRRSLKKRRRRILYLDGGSGSGGSSVSLAQFLKVIDRDRWEPVLITHQVGKTTERIREMGVPIHSFPLRPTGEARGFWWNLFRFHLPLLLRLIREFRAIRPDLIHLNNSPRQPLSAIFAARFLRIPVIAHLRAARPLTSVERFLIRHMKALIVISHFSKDLCERQGVAADVYCIPDGYDMQGIHLSSSRREEARRHLGILNGEPTIGVVARMIPAKGPSQFIEAMETVVKIFPEARAVIVGDECERPSDFVSSLKDQVKKRGLSMNIQFTGWVEKPEYLYPAFDILAQTSLLSEGFSLVCLEAMTYGVPIVSTRVGAVPELVMEGVTGLFVPPGDPKAFADALLVLLKNAPLRQRMGVAAQKRAREVFDIHLTKKKIEALYEEVFNES